jgi:hypothetical protein
MLSPFLICLTLITGALAQDNQTPKPAATIAVTGRVVYEDTGQPATRHRVQLIASDALLNARTGLRIPTVVSNERGEFNFQQVTAGEYYVVAEPIDQHHTQLTSILIRSVNPANDIARLEQFKKNNVRITVDGQRDLEVNIRVPNPHFGTISGTVFDVSHQPAARATVHVVSKNPNTPGMYVRTDDQGRYKVWGLAKGEYIVSANPPSKDSSDGNRTIGFQGSLGSTYFPSTLLAQDSPPVVVAADVDTSNVDVTLLSRALRSISGTVRTRGDNRPVTNATLQLRVKQVTDPTSDTSTAAVESLRSSYVSSTDNSGRWSISNVPDGSYSLFVEPTQSRPTMPRFVQIERDLQLDGADIEDLSIEVSEGVKLSGIVILEGNSGSPQSIDVTAISYKPNAISLVTMNETGKFMLTGVATGEIEVSAFAFPADKFYVKSMEVNGLDLMRNKITITEGEDIKDVRIIVSSSVGVIAGRVLSQTGDKPVAGVNVMLRRTGDDKLRFWGGKITEVTDERGVFTLSAGPGNYFLIAWRSDVPGALLTAMDKAKREQGTGITLSPNSRKEMEIRLP